MKRIFEINFSDLSFKETINKINESIQNGEKIIYMDINADKVVSAKNDPTMLNFINSSDIINPDGVAVVWASKIVGKPLKERIAGIDLFQELLVLSQKMNYRVYFLGAKEEVIKMMIDKIAAIYGEQIIGGWRNGYFEESEEPQIVEEINKSDSQLLFLGITSPKKEYFINRNKDSLKVNFIMGVGGSFDVLAGKVKRAPKFVQKIGLEWLYRIYQEPKRLWKRYAKSNPIFIWLTIKELFKK